MEFRVIEGFGGKYSVSRCGVVYSAHGAGRFLKPKLSLTGYRAVVLQYEAAKKHCSVHRLVALAYIPNPYELPIINHKDGNKLNNAATNLEWCSQAHNVTHGIKRRTEGVSSLINLSYDQFQDMIELYVKGYTYAELNKHFNLKCSAIEWGRVLSGERLSSLSGINEDIRRPTDYSFPDYDDKFVTGVYEDYFINKLRQVDIVRKTGVSSGQVNLWVNGKSRLNLFKKWVEINLSHD